MIHALQPFCPQFTHRTRELLHAVMQAHADAAGANTPASTQVCQIQGLMGLPFESAVMAAINTIGGKHAPVTRTRQFWFYQLDALNHGLWKDSLKARLENGEIIPGFGHSIHKGAIAPELSAARECLKLFPEAESFVNEATEIMQAAKPDLAPNMALFTALACELAGMRFGVESLVFVLPRLPVWAMAWGNAMAEK